MGSLFSKPSIPAQTVYSPASASSTTNTSSSASSNADTGASDAESAAEKARAIVQKKYSMPDTIQTSYRGVLAQGDWVPARKSLLGE